MDVVVEMIDTYGLDPWFPLDGLLAHGSLARQIFILYGVLMFGGLALYFIIGGVSYWFFFLKHGNYYHPKGDPQPFKGQIFQEMKMSVRSTPLMAALTVPFFLAEINGYSKLYHTIADYGIAYYFFSLVVFVLWSDTLIYWIHRELHEIKWLYVNCHKDHHKWKVATPFASIAFHPVDGWMQSLPYHLFPFVFPMHKWTSLVAFAAVQVWSISIHDGVDWSPGEFLNGSAHHTFHHSKFLYNYGQYFTFWDKMCGTYMNPFWQYDKSDGTWKPTEFRKIK